MSRRGISGWHGTARAGLFDTTLAAWNEARKICRTAAAECDKLKLASALASSKTVAAVISLARSDRRLAATVEQWNTDLWSSNTPGGVIDLRTAKMRAHRPTDYMTKLTAVAPDSKCPIPTWLAFLDTVTGKDADLIAFLQRMGGYSLTGSIQEHALFFLYGTGANGKTTFVNVMTGILGDYHKTAPIETFTASQTDHHPTDLAGLRGARLVTSVETEEGRRWAESKIKTLSGGEAIPARFMRQDYFEYVPQFKLVIAGNHKPGLRSVDEAIRRRLHLLPFNVVIPLERRDKTFGDKLRAEWPGILARMIAGCTQWQQIGLAPPKAVTSATDAYLQAEDALAAWIDEQCIHDPNAWERTTTLFAAWKKWADSGGEYAGTIRRFAQNLESHGMTYERQSRARGFRGLRLVGDYVGLNGGGGIATGEFLDPCYSCADIKAQPLVGTLGGQMGYNWQWGAVVAGLEGDINWVSADKTLTWAAGDNSPWFGTATFKMDAFASIRGRMGVAYQNGMVYVTGGPAWGQFKSSVNSAGTSLNATEDTWKTGIAAGAGVSFMLQPNVFLFGEFLALWFEDTNNAYQNVPASNQCSQPGCGINFTHSAELVRVGVNVKFGGY